MQFLIDKSPKQVWRKYQSDLVRGQLITPLTRHANWGGVFAIDNGAFAGFDADAFKSLLVRESENMERCLFVTCPDIVGSARRTLEVFRHRQRWIPDGCPIAFVAQDGLEDLEVPWDEFQCLFIGGLDPWKDSTSVVDLIKTAKIFGKHVHVGRVNAPKRYKCFCERGADTCDGTGVAMYDHMLANIERSLLPEATLFDDQVPAATD